MPVEKTLRDATVVFLRKNGKICLAEKTRHIGEGCLNGYGGEVELGQNIRECASMELFQEAAVIVHEHNLKKVAILIIRNHKSDGHVFVTRVHIFFADRFHGEPRESEEMKNPQWFDETNMPYDRMMPADKYWLELVLEGKKIIAWFSLSPFQKELLKQVWIRPVTEFNE